MAVSWWDKMFGGGATAEGVDQGNAERSAMFQQMQKYLEQQTGVGSSYYDKAYNEWAPLLGGAQQGGGAYADAMGLNGAEGLARANQTFQAMPGYGGALQASNDQILRNQALMGNLASSNTMQGIANNTSNVINQKYGDYVKQLSPYLQMGQDAAAARSGILTGQGNLFTNLGSNVGQWGMNTASQNAQGLLEKGKGIDEGAGRLFSGIMGGLKLAGNLAAPGLGSGLDFGGQLAKAATGGSGYGTGTRGDKYW